jgi:DNA-binding CsgD family transcriptional regulator
VNDAITASLPTVPFANQGAKSMPVKSSKKLEILRRRQQIAELYVQRHTQATIAEKLAISQGTVSADIKAIRREWRNSMVRDFDIACELELQQLDRVEREAWQLFERSQKPAQSAVLGGDGNGSPTRKSMKTRDGDIRALEVILKCGGARRALLGLDAPTRIEPVVPQHQEPFRVAVAQLSITELRAIRRLQDRTVDVGEASDASS